MVETIRSSLIVTKIIQNSLVNIIFRRDQLIILFSIQKQEIGKLKEDLLMKHYNENKIFYVRRRRF